jgi:hypothetical protein
MDVDDHDAIPWLHFTHCRRKMSSPVAGAAVPGRQRLHTLYQKPNRSAIFFSIIADTPMLQ